MPTALLIFTMICAVLGAAFLVGAVSALRGRRVIAGGGRFITAGLFLALAALAVTVTVALRGYRALTHEEVAARIRTVPTGVQRFSATVTLADSSVHMFDLAGDAVYVDAHILKWHPWVNILGLHTAYELDRVAGRYRDLADERSRPRTVESLAPDRTVDLFSLARRYRWLTPLVDAQYGSAAFVSAGEFSTWEIRVSTTGLLARPVLR
jgi:hypothetical protein